MYISGLSHSLESLLKVQVECFFFTVEFERAAKIRKIAVYCFLISLLVPELLKMSNFRSKSGQEINRNQ